MPRTQRFTVYDALEARGVFEQNSANASSPEYVKTEYPRMLYHPDGATRITVPAEIIVTPLGPKAVGEQREIIHRLVENAEEETQAISEGWHLHPSKAIAASGKDAPAMSSTETIENLQKQLAETQAALLTAQGNQLSSITAMGTGGVAGATMGKRHRTE